MKKIPNAETIKVMNETDQGIGLVECKDLDDMYNQLGIKKYKVSLSILSKNDKVQRGDNINFNILAKDDDDAIKKILNASFLSISAETPEKVENGTHVATLVPLGKNEDANDEMELIQEGDFSKNHYHFTEEPL